MKILYLEDRGSNVEEVTRCLEPFGYEIITVDTVAAAQTLLDQTGFSLVLSGIHLEFENAFDLVRVIRQIKGDFELPIVLLDAHQSVLAKAVSESLENTCATLGVTKYLAMETFDESRVRAVVSKLIEDPGSAVRATRRYRKNGKKTQSDSNQSDELSRGRDVSAPPKRSSSKHKR